MSAQVVILAEHRPHASGLAFCMQCKHEWAAVAPMGAVALECPACETQKGRFRFPHRRSGSVWVCNCGNDLFHLTPDGTYCPNCGEWQHA